MDMELPFFYKNIRFEKIRKYSPKDLGKITFKPE